MIETIRPELAVALITACAVLLLVVIAMITDEPKGRHHRKPRARTGGLCGNNSARPDAGPVVTAGPKGTAGTAPALPAVPPHPRYGDLHHTPPGGITALVGDHGIRVGGHYAEHEARQYRGWGA